MGVRTVARAGAAFALVALAACGGGTGVPDRAPEVRGTVASDIGGTTVLTEASDAYFEGMGLRQGEPVIVGADGDRLEPADLHDGDEVEVWVGGACAESYPVQCEIEAIRLAG